MMARTDTAQLIEEITAEVSAGGSHRRFSLTEEQTSTDGHAVLDVASTSNGPSFQGQEGGFTQIQPPLVIPSGVKGLSSFAFFRTISHVLRIFFQVFEMLPFHQ